MVTTIHDSDFESGLLSFSGGTLVASSEGIELGSGCQVLEGLENNKKITNRAWSQVLEELEKTKRPPPMISSVGSNYWKRWSRWSKLKLRGASMCTGRGRSVEESMTSWTWRQTVTSRLPLTSATQAERGLAEAKLA